MLTLEKDLSNVAGFLPSMRHDPALMHSIKQQRGVFLQAGYSRGKPHILTLNRPCKLTRFKLDGLLVLHECDTTFGDSGSPILLKLNGKYYIVAILVGINKDTDKGIAVTSAVFHDHLQTIEEPATPINHTIKICQVPTPVQVNRSLGHLIN